VRHAQRKPSGGSKKRARREERDEDEDEEEDEEASNETWGYFPLGTAPRLVLY